MTLPQTLQPKCQSQSVRSDKSASTATIRRQQTVTNPFTPPALSFVRQSRLDLLARDYDHEHADRCQVESDCGSSPQVRPAHGRFRLSHRPRFDGDHCFPSSVTRSGRRMRRTVSIPLSAMARSSGGSIRSLGSRAPAGSSASVNGRSARCCLRASGTSGSAYSALSVQLRPTLRPSPSTLSCQTVGTLRPADFRQLPGAFLS